ncbi:MAG: antitoxin, partial [Actinomycetales bacterium]
MSNESFFDKVKDFITGHPEQADQGLDKAEQVLDERTGGQYTEQIDKGDDVVRERLGLPDDETTVPEPRDPQAVPGEPTPTPG